MLRPDATSLSVPPLSVPIPDATVATFVFCATPPFALPRIAENNDVGGVVFATRIDATSPTVLRQNAVKLGVETAASVPARWRERVLVN